MTGSHDKEHRVQVRAYHLWEAEGRPEGREAEFWHRAAELDRLESAAGQDSGAAPQPGPDPAPTAQAKKPRAKASPASKSKQVAKEAAAPKAASREHAGDPKPRGTPKSASGRTKARPAEHP